MKFCRNGLLSQIMNLFINGPNMSLQKRAINLVRAKYSQLTSEPRILVAASENTECIAEDSKFVLSDGEF